MSFLFIPYSENFQAKAKVVEQQYGVSTNTLDCASKITSLVASGVAFQYAPYWTLLGALISSWMSIGTPSEKEVKRMVEELKKENPLVKEVMKQADTLIERQVKVYLDLTRTAHVTNAMLSAVFATWIACVRGSHLVTPFCLGVMGVQSAVSLLSKTLNRQSSIQ